MRGWTYRTTRERSLAYALKLIRRICSAKHLHFHVLKDAVKAYRKAEEQSFLAGRSIEKAVAASIYAACRMRDVPCSIKEIAYLAGVPEKDAFRTYRKLVRLLDLKIKQTSPEQYVLRYGSELGMRAETITRANEILKTAKEKGYVPDRSSRTIASSLLYLAGKEMDDKRKQKEISGKLDVSEVSLRNTARKIKGFL